MRKTSRFLHQVFDSPPAILVRDFRLFLIGAKTDSAIKRMHAAQGARPAFEAAYQASDDPWASAAPRYRYQERKYEQIIGLLPDRAYRNALDLGCGLGLLSQRLAACCGTVLGIDIASAALGQARTRAAKIDNLSFEQGDVTDLPNSLNGRFDLVMIADTLYYLAPLNDEKLKLLCARLADLLAPGGICVLANHFFFGLDADSKLSRRIHDAFLWSPRYALLSEHRNAFFLTSILSGLGAPPRPSVG